MRYKSLDEFIPLAMAFFANLPPTPYASALPCGYLCGWRSWDVFKVMQWADFKPTDGVLDVGAFQTFFALWLEQFVGWVDSSDNFYWEKRSFIKEQNLPSSQEWMQTICSLGKRVTATNVDLQEIFYHDNYADKITCISTIEHVLDDVKAMSEMHRVLKPGGRLCITTEYHETQGKPYAEDDGSWYRVYNRETWDALLAPYNVIAQEISTLPHEHWFTVAFACIEKE